MNVLFLTFTQAGYMPPLVLSDRQIIAGPAYDNVTEGGRVVSLRLPLGPFDLPQVIATLPEDQKPELTVVQMDAYENYTPRGLGLVAGRKLLLIADTHHGDGGLAKMLDYARSQPFDRIALIHDPHHLHWFAEAGLRDVRFLPNISVENFRLPFSEARSRQIVFVGQVSAKHPRRRYLLEVMRAGGLPVSVRQARPSEAAQAYADAQISFNCSLNGDLNMRVFEVLAAGGFLITDRLAPQAGLEALFRPGEHYVDYESEAELLEKMVYYLARPEACLAIARAGREAYRAAHTPEQRRREVLDHAFGAPVPFIRDYRAYPDGPGFGENLVERVRLYELLQAYCLEREKLVAVVDSAVGARTVSDLADLRPLDLHVLVSPDEVHAVAAKVGALGVAGQITLAAQPPAGWNIWIGDAGSLGAMPNGDPRALLAVMNADQITALDRTRLSLEGFNPIGGRDWLFGRKG